MVEHDILLREVVGSTLTNYIFYVTTLVTLSFHLRLTFRKCGLGWATIGARMGMSDHVRSSPDTGTSTGVSYHVQSL